MSLFVAAQTAFIEHAGRRVKIIKDETIVRGGHAIMEGREHLFKRLHVHFECERPKPVTPPPAPTPAPAKVAQAKTASAKADATPEPAAEEE
jgi:hypothetical protein